MTQSIYQVNGRPLSQTAIYQQRLKQGVFKSPSSPSVGVDSNASDAAALLANSSDLTVKPVYERTIAQEASTAALLAKKEEVSIWSRENVDPNAENAAANAGSSIYSGATTVDSKKGPGIGVGEYDKGSVFKVATKQSSTSMNDRINPEKDSRHGLASKSAAASLNIARINQVANKNSASSLYSRFNPELDHRSGVLPPKTAEYLDQEEENLAMKGAGASLKHGGSTTANAAGQSRSKSFKASDVQYPHLLAAANEKANDRLKSINSSSSKDFKLQAIVYASALALAQKQSDERQKNYKAGVVDLGGGLTMTQSELDQKASLIVGPVLSDITAKAKSQREADKALKVKQQELELSHQKAKEEEIARKEKERQDIEQAKRERVVANEEKKKQEDQKYAEYQQSRHAEVDAKVEELRLLELQYSEQREALLVDKQENQDRLDEEERQLIAAHEQEIRDLQAEKDESLKPLLEELEGENAKLKEVVATRTELQEEVEKLETVNQEYNEKLEDLNKDLETVRADIEQYTSDLEAANQEHDELAIEVGDLHKSSAAELEEIEKSDKELDAKLAEDNKTKEEHLKNKKAQKEEIKSKLDQSVKNEHEVNAALPGHLKRDIDEGHIKDTGSLFSVEAPTIKEIPLVDKKELKAAASPSKPKVELSVPTAKATTASKPLAKTAENIASKSSESPKKKSGFKRFTKIFSTPSQEQKSTGVVPEIKKPAAEKKVVEPKSKPSTVSRLDSEIDDISLGKNGNKGGLFQEDI